MLAEGLQAPGPEWGLDVGMDEVPMKLVSSALFCQAVSSCATSEKVSVVAVEELRLVGRDEPAAEVGDGEVVSPGRGSSGQRSRRKRTTRTAMTFGRSAGVLPKKRSFIRAPGGVSDACGKGGPSQADGLRTAC